MNKFNKLLITRNNYIEDIKSRATLADFNVENVIKEPLFTAYIAKGHPLYKEFILNRILKGKDFDKKSIVFQRFEVNKNNIESLKAFYLQNIENKDIGKIINYQKSTWLKFLGITSIEEIEAYLNIDLSQFKQKYNDYLCIINNLNKEPASLEIFLENEKKSFNFHSGLILNLNNLLNLTSLPDHEKLIMKTDFINYKVRKQLELEQKLKEEQRIESERLVNEKQIKIQTRLKTHLDFIESLKSKKVTYADIIELLENKDSCTVMKNKSLNESDLITYFGLSKSRRIKKEKELYLKQELLSQELLKKYNIRGKLIHNMHVRDILNIKPIELIKWKDDGRLVVAESRSFNKWGYVLSSDFFDPKFLLSITPEIISDWRIQDKIIKGLKTTEQPGQFSLAQTATRIKLMKQLHEHGFLFSNNKWYALVKVQVYEFFITDLVKLNVDIQQKIKIKEILEKLSIAKNNINFNNVTKKLVTKIDSYGLDDDKKKSLLIFLTEKTNQLNIIDFNENTIKNHIQFYLKEYLEDKTRKYIQESTQLNKYEDSFPLARSLGRNIKIIVGPTNSGKTHDALQHLMSAESGVYLAPLRLLAMEIYDKLNSAGIACNLMTGEEKIIIPNAKHTASTIEIINLQETVDVAIIDEFQMLDDKQRGWAWTQAMVGVPAKTVYVIGNKSKLLNATVLYKTITENVEIIEKKRFNELKNINQFVEIDNLKKGDAVIAFSRKDVLSYASLIKENNFKVSIIYGALSPEVRRKQSEMFNSGETDILVSTDAIGMGLNLPIKRIIFATLQKFDGEEVRNLNTSEILQIAGRAGRYGLHENGYVGALKNKVNKYSTSVLLNNAIKSDVDTSYKLLGIAPNNWHMKLIAETLKTKDLEKILNYFSSLNYGVLYKSSNLEHIINLYKEIKPHIKSLSLDEQYRLCCAPLAVHEKVIVGFYINLIKQIKSNEDVHFNFNEEYSLEYAETVNKALSLYCWMSFYYDNLNTDNISSIRENLSNNIQEKLLNYNHIDFSTMIEPRNDRYNRFEDDDDDKDY